MVKNSVITKKKQLEMALQRIPGHPTPKAHLEQYKTPAEIGADVLWNALTLGDIEDKKVVDLGCGTGMFAIGAALLGAKESVCVDVDEDAVALAESQAHQMGINHITKFIPMNIKYFLEVADTVIQNPPFGAQKTHRKEADRFFMVKAIEIAPVVYSFHIKETEKFVERFFNSLGGSITHRFYYRFSIPRTYDFHEKEKIDINVVAVRVERG